MSLHNKLRVGLAAMVGALILESVFILVKLSQHSVQNCAVPIDYPVSVHDSQCANTGSFQLPPDHCNFTVCRSENLYAGVLGCENTRPLPLDGESLLMLDAWLLRCYENPNSPCVDAARRNSTSVPVCEYHSTDFPLITSCTADGLTVGVSIDGLVYLEHSSLQQLHKILELFVVHLL